MPDTVLPSPAAWHRTLALSEAQAEAGDVVPMETVLAALRSSLERLAAKAPGNASRNRRAKPSAGRRRQDQAAAQAR